MGYLIIGVHRPENAPADFIRTQLIDILCQCAEWLVVRTDHIHNSLEIPWTLRVGRHPGQRVVLPIQIPGVSTGGLYLPENWGASSNPRHETGAACPGASKTLDPV